MALLRVNNTILSWNSCSLKINGIPYTGLTAVNFGQKRERPKQWGMKKNGVAMGKVSGKYDCDCQMTFYRDEFEQFTTDLLLQNPQNLNSYGDCEFNWVLTYFEPQFPTLPPITIIGTGCTIESEKDSNQEGTDALLTEVEVNVLSILRNGKSLASTVRGLSPI